MLHIWSATKLSLENKAARPVGLRGYKPVGSSYASRTMLMGGSIVFVFIIYHLLHYTVMVQGDQFDRAELRRLHGVLRRGRAPRHDIFKMMVVGFRNGWVSAFYVLGVGLLCLHLSHGASSMFQSMGWRNEVYRPFLDGWPWWSPGLIFLGYVSIPVAILLGYGKEVLEVV